MSKFFISSIISVIIHVLVATIFIVSTVPIVVSDSSVSDTSNVNDTQWISVDMNSFIDVGVNHIKKFVYAPCKQKKVNKLSRSSANDSDDGNVSLNLRGWMLKDLPDIDDSSFEIGTITFAITVDDFGTVTDVRTLKKTISRRLEQAYMEATYKLVFVRKDKRSVGAGGTISYSIMYK